ncbi:MAG: hypothetical protein HY606_11660 [Planctomycetes bacterium]|nr:hypothetical protein [Planctomycetota bacterium]
MKRFISVLLLTLLVSFDVSTVLAGDGSPDDPTPYEPPDPPPPPPIIYEWQGPAKVAVLSAASDFKTGTLNENTYVVTSTSNHAYITGKIIASNGKTVPNDPPVLIRKNPDQIINPDFTFNGNEVVVAAELNNSTSGHFEIWMNIVSAGSLSSMLGSSGTTIGLKVPGQDGSSNYHKPKVSKTLLDNNGDDTEYGYGFLALKESSTGSALQFLLARAGDGDPSIEFVSAVDITNQTYPKDNWNIISEKLSSDVYTIWEQTEGGITILKVSRLANNHNNVSPAWTGSSQFINDGITVFTNESGTLLPTSDYQFKLDKDGNLIIVASVEIVPGNKDVRLQKINTDGTRSFGNSGAIVTETEFFNETKPSMTFIGATAVVVAWERTEGGQKDIYGQKLHLSDGSRMWGINSGMTQPVVRPVGTTNPGSLSPGGTPPISGRLPPSTSTVFQGGLPIAVLPGSEQHSPKIVLSTEFDTSFRLVISWLDNRDNPSENKMYSNGLSGEGVLLNNSDLKLGTTNGTQGPTGLEPNFSGDAVGVYFSPVDNNIYANLDNNGSTIRPSAPDITSTQSSQGVTVSWQVVSNFSVNQIGFRVYRRVNGINSTFQQLANVDPGTFTYLDGQVQLFSPATTVFYKVASFINDTNTGNTAFSNPSAQIQIVTPTNGQPNGNYTNNNGGGSGPGSAGESELEKGEAPENPGENSQFIPDPPPPPPASNNTAPSSHKKKNVSSILGCSNGKASVHIPRNSYSPVQLSIIISLLIISCRLILKSR